MAVKALEQICREAGREWPGIRIAVHHRIGRLAIGEAVVSDLLREGRVTLVRGEWTGPRHEREAVADEQAALLGWATWVPQPGEPITWMTDA